MAEPGIGCKQWSCDTPAVNRGSALPFLVGEQMWKQRQFQAVGAPCWGSHRLWGSPEEALSANLNSRDSETSRKEKVWTNNFSTKQRGLGDAGVWHWLCGVSVLSCSCAWLIWGPVRTTFKKKQAFLPKKPSFWLVCPCWVWLSAVWMHFPRALTVKSDSPAADMK